MRLNHSKKYLTLITWIVALIAIGSIIGSLTIADISTWYSTLNRSPMTPPNYVFPVIWNILYSTIGSCGWAIWHTTTFPALNTIKTLYVTQLILNWSWTPLFFHFHLIKTSLLVLIAMDIIVGMLILLAYPKIKTVALLMVPYLLWILVATYLNFYIWQNNWFRYDRSCYFEIFSRELLNTIPKKEQGKTKKIKISYIRVCLLHIMADLSLYI